MRKFLRKYSIRRNCFCGRMKIILFVFCLSLAFSAVVRAQSQSGGLSGSGSSLSSVGSSGPLGVSLSIDAKDTPANFSKSLNIFLLLTALSVAPSAIIMTTSFVRIMIVLGMLRRALGTQSTPPGQILAAMSLFLTMFIMMPVWNKINTDAVKPYMAEEISQEVAWERGVEPLKKFMSMQTGESELALFVELAGEEPPETLEDVSMRSLMPAFMLSELKTAFQMGFLIYLPFLVIDLVIASSLMSLGMMMLPPMMISLPIKILFFVLADGWVLLVRGIVSSFKL